MTCIQNKKDKRKNPTILRVPDKLWDEIKSSCPKEKPSKTVGLPIMKCSTSRTGLKDIILLYICVLFHRYVDIPKC